MVRAGKPTGHLHKPDGSIKGPFNFYPFCVLPLLIVDTDQTPVQQ